MIVVDIYLSGQLDGIAAARAIRLFDRWTPIVVVTAAQDPAWRLAAREAGANEFLCKPITSEMLASALAAVVSLKCAAGPALHAALWAGDEAEFGRLLGMAPEAADWAEDRGVRLVHVASRRGDARLLARLLAAGADPRAESDHGYAPLHVAAWSDSVACVELLLAAGCDLRQKVRRMIDNVFGSHSAERKGADCAGRGGTARGAVFCSAGHCQEAHQIQCREESAGAAAPL